MSVTCPRCQSEHIVKNGHIHNGKKDVPYDSGATQKSLFDPW